MQSLLITKRVLFLGFSLLDNNFHKIVDTVRLVVKEKSNGTALFLLKDQLTKLLWENDLDIIAMKDLKEGIPTGKDFAEAARIHDIFLDYLSLKSTSIQRHLLEPRFNDILSYEEIKFKEYVFKFLSETPSEINNAEPYRKLLEAISTKFKVPGWLVTKVTQP